MPSSGAKRQALKLKFIIKKIFISGFIILNLSCVLLSNRLPFPKIFPQKKIQYLKENASSYYLTYFKWLVQNYAYYVGLNNQWIMFGRQSRFNWWYTIKAKYNNGEEVILPLPRQSKRTFFQKFFVDFKEVKFQNNIYESPKSLWAYAHYLCEKYPQNKDRKIVSILYQLNWQNIISREEASRSGRYLEPNIYNQPPREISCHQECPL